MSDRSELIESLKYAVKQGPGALTCRDLQEAISALEAVPVWVKCSERMPEIDYSKPEYERVVDVIATDGKQVRQLRYKSQGFAATEKGKLPRFEEMGGRLAWMTPTEWQPLPAPPIVEQGEK